MLTYRFILLLVVPVVAVRLLVAWLMGRETVSGLRQRLAHGSGPATNDPLLWVHGASLGELISAKSVIYGLLDQNPNLQMLVTANTYTGRDQVLKWQNPRVQGRLAPLDTPRIVTRFLRKWQPVAAITLENEIWPARTLLCARSNTPVISLAARMSAKSATNWARFGSISSQVMPAIAWLMPQDINSADRFNALGTPRDKIGPLVNLKVNVVLPDPDLGELAVLSAAFERHNTLLAASTHSGDEALILRAFQVVRKSVPTLRLIIAPRHPQRFDKVAKIVVEQGLSVCRRSRQDAPTQDCDVYLADSIGEMALFYSIAAVTVLGGSFSNKGGHTPFEPAQFGSLVVHGPDVANHQHAYDLFRETKVSFCAQDADELADIIVDMHKRNDQKQLADRAIGTLDRLRQDFDVLGQLRRHLSQLTGRRDLF